jgi:hypothetical protein
VWCGLTCILTKEVSHSTAGWVITQLASERLDPCT